MAHALLIDDNANNLGVLAGLLAQEGVTFTKVQDPTKLEEALATLNQLDVVFLDLEMPDVDGYAILEMFKSNPDFQGIPIVAYTVHVSEMNNARLSGFDSFIGKPLNSERFPGQLARILRGESVWTTV